MSEPSDKHDKASVETGDRYPGDLIFGWTSHPRTSLFIFAGMAILSAVLFLADFVIHRHHEYVKIAEYIGFYAFFGFIAFAGVVLSGWPLRKLLGRPENYYEPEERADD